MTYYIISYFIYFTYINSSDKLYCLSFQTSITILYCNSIIIVTLIVNYYLEMEKK